MNLMKITEIGGRLGIQGKEALKGFTEAIDKAYVALGDSFEGGLEAVTTQLGKLKNLFSETSGMDYPEAINRVGSALNELAANGTSSEQNIAEFATRVGQLPDALKPSAAATLGMGAAFEESGEDARIAASGYSRFMSSAAQNIEAFAYTMNMGVKEAKELLNTHPEEFFIRFSEGMVGLDASQTASIFKDLKLNTLEIQKSVGAAGKNAARFREMMQMSATAMSEATSLTDEFNKKNNNSAAIWEKIWNTIANLTTDEFIPEWFDSISQFFGAITGITSEAGNGVEVFRERLKFLVKSIMVATTAFFSLKAAIWLTARTTKQAAVQNALFRKSILANILGAKVYRGILLLLGAAKFALTGNIKKATQAMRVFSRVTKLNPWGLLVSVVLAAVTAYQLFSKKLDETARKKKMFNEISATAEKQIVKERNEFEKYLSIAKDEKVAKEKRLEAMKKLKEIAPDYLEGITLETINTDKATAATKKYIDELKRKSYFQAIQNKVVELQQKAVDLKHQDPREQMDWVDKASNWLASGNEDYNGLSKISMEEVKKLDELAGNELDKALGKYNHVIERAYRDRRKAIEENQKEIETLLTEQKKYAIEQLGKEDDNTPQNRGLGGSDSKNNKQLSSAYKKAIEEREKTERAALQNQWKLEEERLALRADSFEKEEALLNLQTEKKVTAICNETEKLEEEIGNQNLRLEELRAQSQNSKLTDGQRSSITEEIVNLKQSIAAKQQIIQTNGEREVAIWEATESKIAALRHKYDLKEVANTKAHFDAKITQKKYEAEKMLSEINSLEEAKNRMKDSLSDEELAKIKTLEAAKKAIRKQTNEAVLKMQTESLQAQITLMEKMLPKLTGEAAEKMKEDLLKLYEAFQKVKQSLNGNAGNPECSDSEGLDRVDVLGFSAAQWESTFSNLDSLEGKMAAVGMAFSALGNAAQMYAEHQRNINDRELVKFQKNQTKKKKLLESQLNAGIISQEQYHNQMAAMDAKAEAKKQELALKQAKAEKAARMFSIIGDTAMGVAKAMALPFPKSLVVGAIYSAIGAAQLAIVAGQKLPSYHVGGFTGGLGFRDGSGHEVAGAVHEGEYVIPKWLLKKPEVANVAEWLETKRKGTTASYDEGGYTSTATQNREQITNPDYGRNDTTSIALIQVLYKLSEILEEIDRKGIDAYVVSNAKNGREMQRAIKEFKEIQDKNKR